MNKKFIQRTLLFSALTGGLFLASCQKEAVSTKTATKNAAAFTVAGIKKDTIIIINTRVAADTSAVKKAPKGK